MTPDLGGEWYILPATVLALARPPERSLADMKRCVPTGVALRAALLACAALAAPLHARSVRIMPLGDSITESVTTFASYRYWLWQDLVGAGYDVDFVGTERGVLLGPPLFDDFDQDHEGHTGFRTDEVLPHVAEWAATSKPDIVLIHLGTNDLWQGRDVEDVRADMHSIVIELRSVNPRVIILLAEIIPSTQFDVEPLNRALHKVAVTRWTPQSPVHAVDQHTGFFAVGDTWDGVHPDQGGEMKIATRFFEALQWFLRDPYVATEPPGGRQATAPSAGAGGHRPWNPRLQRVLLRAALLELERLRLGRAR